MPQASAEPWCGADHPFERRTRFGKSKELCLELIVSCFSLGRVNDPVSSQVHRAVFQFARTRRAPPVKTLDGARNAATKATKWGKQEGGLQVAPGVHEAPPGQRGLPSAQNLTMSSGKQFSNYFCPAQSLFFFHFCFA